MMMVLVMGIYAIIKELVQMSQQVLSHARMFAVSLWIICFPASVFMFYSVSNTSWTPPIHWTGVTLSSL